MYDPVLNRPMFQAQNTATPMAAAPMGAKGTGITSMVTSPDPDTTMQQLKAFGNPAAPTVGFAEGGPVQHFQQGGPAVSSMWDNFVNSLTIKEPNRSGNYRLPDIGLRIGENRGMRQDAGITGGTPSYTGGDIEPINMGGRAALVSGQSQDPSTLSNLSASGVRGTSYIAEEPRDREERAAIESNDEYNQSRLRIRQQQEQQARAERESILRRTQQEEERLANSPGSSGPGISSIPIPPEGAPSREPSQPPAQNRTFVNPYQADPSDRDERARIEGLSVPIKTDTVVNPGASSGGGGSIATQLAQIKAERNAQSAADRRENALMALMSAGFGMAAGKSRHALTNIAEGGQQGIASFAALERSRREDENRRYLAALHERELLAKEPYMQAQTEQARAQAAYLRARPGIEQARLSEAARRADSRARLQAEKDVYAHMDKNPAAYLGANGKPDQMKIDAEIALRKKNIEPNILYDMLNGGRQTDNSSGE